jgi:antitoxin MazE
MRVKLIDIGNSKGIRLPKALIEEIGFKDEVELRRTKDGLNLMPVKETRAGWAEQFKKDFIPDSKSDHSWQQAGNKFDKEEWTW